MRSAVLTLLVLSSTGLSQQVKKNMNVSNGSTASAFEDEYQMNALRVAYSQRKISIEVLQYAILLYM